MKAKKTLLLLCCFLFLPISMHLDKKRSLSSSEVKATFYLANPYQNNYLSPKFDFGGIGGGIGIGALIGIGGALIGGSHSGGGTGHTTIIDIPDIGYEPNTSTTATTLDLLNKTLTLHPELKNELNTHKYATSELDEIILKLCGCTTFLDFKKKVENKIMTLGRFDKGDNEKPTYAIVGESMNALTFYTPDINFWNENKLLCNILNRVILTYAIDEDFDFILCTDPYYYLDEHLSEYSYWYKDNANLFDRDPMCDSCSYRMEISMVRNYGYNTFVNNPYTWSTLPNTHYPFTETDYRVSR